MRPASFSFLLERAGRFHWLLLLGISFLIPNFSSADNLSAKTAEARVHEGGEAWRYYLYLPKEYTEDSESAFPLFFWLHGRSLRGKDLEKTRRYGPPAFLDDRDDFPFVTVCPQLPDGAWPADGLNRLLAEVLEIYHIDPDRVVLSGASLGAMGAWNFAGAHPERFAALIPVCAHGPMWVAEKLLHVPIRAVHGDADDIVPMAPHVALVEKIQRLGGSAEIKIVPGGTHGSVIGPTYRDKEWWNWMLAQRRQAQE